MYKKFVLVLSLVTAFYTSNALIAQEIPGASEEKNSCYDPEPIDRANSYKDTGDGTVESITYEVNCDNMILTAKMTTKLDEMKGNPANIASLRLSMQRFFCSSLGKFSPHFDAGWTMRFRVHNNENSKVYGFLISDCIHD